MEAEKVQILTNLYINVLEHPWVDENLRDAMLDII